MEDSNDLNSSESEEVSLFFQQTLTNNLIKSLLNVVKKQLLRLLAYKELSQLDDDNDELAKRYILLPRIGNAKRSFYLPRIGKKAFEMEKRTFLKPRVGK